MQVTKIDRSELADGMALLMISPRNQLVTGTIQLGKVAGNTLFVHERGGGYQLALPHVKERSRAAFFRIDLDEAEAALMDG